MPTATDPLHCATCHEPLTLAADAAGATVLRCTRCKLTFQLNLDAIGATPAAAATGAAPVSHADQPTLHLGKVLESHWHKTLLTAARAANAGRPTPADDDPPATGRTLKPDATILLEPGDRPSLRPTSLPRVHIATHTTDTADPAKAPAGASPAALEILTKLGEGGMGTVYRARQTALGRDVALKQIHAADATNNAVQMFLHEAQATGLLDHPNIVPVHELGIDTQGQVFYTMKLVHGKPWSEFLHPAQTAAAPTAAAAASPTLDLAGHLEVLLKVADAIAFAHARGILHRDLKPDNVMIGDFGEVLVVDWGLACGFHRAKPTAVALPQAADISTPCGTPQYMPPEMALGLGRQIGAPSDVYLLGAILYEILFHRPPHQAKTVWQVLRLAARNQLDWTPPAAEPAATYFQVLEPVLWQALHSDSYQRFADAGVFARELRARLRHFDSIALARNAQERLERLAPTTTITAAPATATPNPYAEFDEALAALRQALHSWPENELARTEQVRGHAAYARFALGRGDLALAAAQADAGVAAANRFGHPRATDLAQLAAAVQTARADAARRATRLKTLQRAVAALAVLVIIGAAVAVLWINAARNRAVAAEQSTATERDKARAAEQQAVTERDRTTAAAYVATIGMASRYAYEANTLRTDQLLAETPAALRGWEYDWVRAKAHQEIATWRPADGDLPRLLAVHPTRPAALVAGLGAAALQLWDAGTGNIERQFPLPGGAVVRAQFSPDGTHILVAGDNDKITLFDAHSGAALKTLDASLLLPCLFHFTPDGSHFLFDDRQGRIVYAAVATGQVEKTIPVEDSTIACAALRADGKELLLGLSRGEMLRLSLPDFEELERTEICEGYIHACGYLDDTAAIAVVEDGEMVPWLGIRQVNFGDTETPTADRWSIESQRIMAAEISADGQTVAVATFDQRLQVWRADLPTRFSMEQSAYLRLQGHTAGLYEVHLAAHGRWGATAARDGTVKMWNLLGLQSVHFLQSHMGAIQALAPVPGGRAFLTGGMRGEVFQHRLDDFHTDELFTTPQEERLLCLTVDPTATWLVTADESGNLLRWSLKNPDAGQPLTTTASKPVACQFHPTGKQLLVAATRDPVRIWDPIDSKKLAELALPENHTASAATFSPDGALVLAATDERLYAWDWQANQVRWSVLLPGQPATLRRLCFSPDGQRLCGAGQDGDLRLWSWSADAAPPPPTILKGHASVVTDCAFSPDGRRLVSGSYDRTVKLWDLTQNRELISYNAKIYDTTCPAIYTDSDIISFDHASNVDRVLFTADGKGIVYCKSDGRPVLLMPPADNLAEFTRANQAYLADPDFQPLPP